LTLILVSAVMVLDQATKCAVRSYLSPGESEIIASFFNLAHVRNTGAVWGCFQHQNEWLAVISAAVLFLLALFYRCLSGNRAVGAAAVGLIAGGIIGNLIDRIKLGWVVDFLDFYWRDWHWPAFNVADAAICAGVFLYLLSSLPLFPPNKQDPHSRA
jgi:signal peptidase II